MSTPDHHRNHGRLSCEPFNLKNPANQDGQSKSTQIFNIRSPSPVYTPKYLVEILDILFEAAVNTDLTKDEVDVQAISDVDPGERAGLTNALLPHIRG